jgi:hypothetical protein
MSIIKNYKDEIVEIRFPTLSFIEDHIGVYIDDIDEYTKRIFNVFPHLRILKIKQSVLFHHNNIFMINGLRRIIIVCK